MQRINAIDPQTATGMAKTLLDGVQRKLGFVPNLMRTFAVSPATLDAYLSFNDRLSHGILSPKLREQLALTLAQASYQLISLQLAPAVPTINRNTATEMATTGRAKEGNLSG